MPRRRPTSRLTRDRARKLRRDITIPERCLWQALRDRRLAGLKFVRQAPIEPYIVDFLCRQRRLVIELDGESHAVRGRYDQHREADLRSRGFTIFRVANDDVLRDLEAVLTAIVREAGLDAAAWRDGKLPATNDQTQVDDAFET